MFGRPRCREWTPLATQQLRLRSLIQIVGYNIRPPEWCSSQCSFYVTLHHTTMSAPFYTSERISSPHPKWKEIDSEIIHRMSSTNIVIRIWIHMMHPNENTQDRIIQTWGVYLSGLRYIGANLASNFNSDCFKSNTLVFQMHGGYFCSYKSLKLDIIPPEYDLEQGSPLSDSSGRTNPTKIPLDSRAFLNHRLVKESRSLSPSKYPRKVEREYSKSQSPVERGFQQNFPALKTSASMNITRNDTDPSSIYEHSPENLDVKVYCDSNCDNLSKTSQEDLSSKIDLSETAENYDLRNEDDRVPKYRYLAINFLKSEIRPSYNATKLQKLHLLQYSIKKKQEAVQEIKERIYKNSAVNDRKEFDAIRVRRIPQIDLFSLDESLSKDKSGSQSELNGRIREDKPVSNGPRLGLKLNDLLSIKTKPSPYQRAEHVRLTKQLEILRFKRIILSDERDSKLANIRRLKERHAKLSEENQDVGTELMQSYHTLSKRNDTIKEMRQSCSALRELAARSHSSLCTHRNELLTQLHQIFYIQHVNQLTWSIVGVPLAVCGDDGPRGTGGGGAGGGGAVREAVACGFAAQATCVAAALLAQPLRYRLTLLGSATKILDLTADLPDPNIPLYTRGGDVTLFRYAMFLLNKCIGQLCAGRGLPIADIRPTLLNLERMLTSNTSLSDASKLYGVHHWFSEGQCPRTQSLRSLVATERERKYRQFNRFKDAVDGHPPQSALVKRHRHSRSVGSYHDDHELAILDASTTSIMGSESNIYNIKLTTNETTETKLKTHSSESEISKMADEPAVIFTLGDDTALANLESKLVRLSTNNDDEITCASCLDDNVKIICTEITDFCTKEIHEGFDVAKYLERRESCVSEIEEADQCVNCESKKDGDCQLDCSKSVTDVIVIPSAEAILDTGQTQDGADLN